MAADLERRGHLLIVDREGRVGEDEAANPLDHVQLLVDAINRRREQCLQIGRVGEFGFRHQQPDEVGVTVAVDHCLRNLGLERQHPLYPLGRDIVALVVDDEVLLAVGDDDPPRVVEMPDVAGRKP